MILEIIFVIYVLINFIVVADKILMPVLLTISKKYELSKDHTGIVVAVGNLIPEAATTFNSFTRPNI